MSFKISGLDHITTHLDACPKQHGKECAREWVNKYNGHTIVCFCKCHDDRFGGTEK